MKRLAGVLFALVLCAALTVPALAAGVTNSNGGTSSYLLASQESTGTITFVAFGGREETAHVYPAGTVMSLNLAEHSLLSFNVLNNAQDPFAQLELGGDFFSLKEFTLQPGIIYNVQTFDGSSFAGDTCYVTAAADAAPSAPAAPAEPTAPPAPAEPTAPPAPAVPDAPADAGAEEPAVGVTPAASDTFVPCTITLSDWETGATVTAEFAEAKVAERVWSMGGEKLPVIVVTVKPESAVPDTLVSVGSVKEENGTFIVGGIRWRGEGTTMQELFLNGEFAADYLLVAETKGDKPVYLELAKEEPAQPEPPAASEVPDAPEQPAEEQQPVEDAPAKEEESVEAPAAPETGAQPQPVTPVEKEEPAGGSSAVIIAAVAAVAVIGGGAAVVVLKKKKV